jgi:multiple sugar transport system substrate-binding protein
MEKKRLSRRDFLRMSAITAAGAALASCAPRVTPEPEGEAVTDTPAPMEPVVLNYWLPSGETEEGSWAQHDEWAQQYDEQNPNVSFEFGGPGWDDYWTKLPLEIASGTGPDLFWFHFNWMIPFVGGGLMEPFSAEDTAEIKNKVAFIDNFLVDGKLYWWAEGWQTRAMFWNKEMLEEVGITSKDELPKDWEGFIELAKEMTQYDDSGEVTRAGFHWYHGDVRWTWADLKVQLGEYFFSEDGRRGTMYTPGGIQVAQQILDWEFEDKVGSTDLPGNVFDAFTSDLAAVTIGAGWMENQLLDNFPDKEVYITNMPTPGGAAPPAYCRRTPEATSGVSSQSQNKEAAFEFVKWYTTDPDIMIERANGGVVPSLKAIQDTVEDWGGRWMQTALEAIERTLYLGTPPPEWENMFNLFTEPVYIARSMEVEPALEEAQLAMDEVLSEEEYPLVLWGYQEREYAHADEMYMPEILV